MTETGDNSAANTTKTLVQWLQPNSDAHRKWLEDGIDQIRNGNVRLFKPLDVPPSLEPRDPTWRDNLAAFWQRLKRRLEAAWDGWCLRDNGWGDDWDD